MGKRKTVPVSELPVMKAHCKTCPFRDSGNGCWADVQLANAVIGRTLFQAQQICHGTEGKNRKARNRCKGAYDYSSEIYRRLGWGDMITDVPRGTIKKTTE